jgi:hypothetical protein
MANNPWLNKTWQLRTISGPATPLMVKGDDDGRKNRFRLVAGSRTGNRINYFKVKFKKGAMTKHWKDCIFVPRGNDAVLLQDSQGASIAPLGPDPTDAAISGVSSQLITAIDANRPIGSARLECDVKLPAIQFNTTGTGIGESSRKVFGLLRLFQVPKALGSEALLVIDFSLDRGLPGGSGSGGSVRD